MARTPVGKPLASALLLLAFLTLASVMVSPVHAFASGQGASVVLGQPNFTGVGSGRVVRAEQMVFDNLGNLWVADYRANRVLRFSPPFADGMSANLVIGQPDFTSSGSGTTAQNFYGPNGVAIDKNGNLWVTDYLNNRVLEFSPPFSNGMSASLVIGHASFTTKNEGVTAQYTLSTPWAAAFDSSGNLWVSDTGNDRVLRYAQPFSNGMNANLIIGQSDFTSYSSNTTPNGFFFPDGISIDSSGNLWVADNFNNRVLRFSPPFSNGMAANLVVGQTTFYSSYTYTTQSGLDGPEAAFADSSGNLWVADSYNYRVLEFQPPFANGMSASLAIGQSTFTKTDSIGAQTWLNFPTAASIDSSGNLWVSDYSNGALLKFSPPFSTGMAASLVIGQGPNSLSSPRGVLFDSSGNLWVGDSSNNRVLEFTPPFTSGLNASLVIGQPNFFSDSQVPSQSGLTSAGGVLMDSSGNLWISDFTSNRILRFIPPFTSGMNANLVIGQSGFASSTSSTTQTGLYTPKYFAFDSSGDLWVGDSSNNRVLEYTPPFTSGMSASLVIGQASFTSSTRSTTQSGLYYPEGITFDSAGDLWVADESNNRTLMFSPPFSNGMNANLVLGQPSFTSAASSTTQSGMSYPEGVAFDPRGNLWVTDSANNRILRFSPPFTNGMSANLVLGQSIFTSSAAADTQSGLNYPRISTFDSAGNLWVSDRYNYRVLEFTCGTECPSSSLSFSYSVQGGGSGYSAPTLTYMFGGIPRTSTLSTTSTSVSIDYGSSWSVSTTLPGSTASERWASSKAVSGTATAAQTVSVTYYHQYDVNLGYSVKGGGAGYTPPTVNYTQYSSQASANAGSSAWVDAGSTYAMPAQLAGSSSTERWAARSSSGTVASSAAVSVAYYHQFLFTASYSIVGGGTPTAPTLNSVQFAALATTSLTASPTGYWLDSGSSWNMTNPLQGSGNSERWFAAGAPSGSASSAATVNQAYHHQYFLTVQASPAEGGSATPGSDWHDSASSVQVTATANSGWQFTGWTGTGTGSYSGSNSSATLSVSGALTEVANFKPLATTTSSTATSTTTSSSQSATTTSTTATSSQTSTTTTTTSASTTTPTTSTTSSTTPTTSSSTASTASTTGGGAIPEYPFQLLVILAFTALVILSYIAARTRGPSRDSGAIRS